MLKALLASVLSLFMAGTAFAQTFTFESVNGFVAISDGRTAATAANASTAITHGAVITTGAGASATIKVGTCSFTIPANSTVSINPSAGCTQNVVQLSATQQTAGLTGTAGAGTLNLMGIAALGVGAIAANQVVKNLDKSPK